jgi:hypothetical protein
MTGSTSIHPLGTRDPAAGLHDGWNELGLAELKLLLDATPMPRLPNFDRHDATPGNPQIIANMATQIINSGNRCPGVLQVLRSTGEIVGRTMQTGAQSFNWNGQTQGWQRAWAAKLAATETGSPVKINVELR